MKWLIDHNQNELDKRLEQIELLENEKKSFSTVSTDWLTSQTEEIKVTHKLNSIRLEYEKIVNYDNKIKEMYKNTKSKFTNKKISNRKVENKLAENDNDLEETDDTDDNMLLTETEDNVEEEEEDDSEDEDQYQPTKVCKIQL